jgi:hypothetical protein
MTDPGDIATRQETCVVRDGLTCEFRDSVKYQSWRADILQKIPGASDFFVDTAIYWYLSKPDMFETEDGKRWIAEMEARKRRPQVIKEEEKEDEADDDDDDRPNLPDAGHGDLLDDTRVCGSAAAAAIVRKYYCSTADSHSDAESGGAGVQDVVPVDEA